MGLIARFAILYANATAALSMGVQTFLHGTGRSFTCLWMGGNPVRR
ncbi:hypothetical protein [Nonomuraea rubra]